MPPRVPISSPAVPSPPPPPTSTSASIWNDPRRRGANVLLVIDVGNTQTLIGLYAGVELTHHWRSSTNAERTADEHALLVAEFLDLAGLDVGKVVTGMAVSSVVPRITAALRDMSERWLNVPTVVIEPGTRTGIPILYENPKEVGADRVANAVGAYDL